jgi:Fe-S-cluster containining protein
MKLEDLCQHISEHYRLMSEAFGSAQTSAGLRCPTDCGKCCTTPTIEASVMEMLPMALELFHQGEAEEMLTELGTRDLSTCVLLERFTADGARGWCRMYAQRPSVCRMFGVGAVLRKDDERELSLCRELRTLFTSEVARIDKAQMPLMSEWGLRGLQIHPDFLRERRPISIALCMALEKVLFHKSLSRS